MFARSLFSFYKNNVYSNLPFPLTENNCLCFYSLEEIVSYVEVTTGARKHDTNYSTFLYNSQTNEERNGKVTLVMIKNVLTSYLGHGWDGLKLKLQSAESFCPLSMTSECP